MATTDRGSNELWCKKAVQCIMKDVPSFFYLGSDCYEHIAHLGTLGALRACDQILKGYRPWKYFSSVAIVTNTLRDLSQRLFATWRTLYGDSDAVAKVKTMIPRCIGGRWGSIAETENRLIQANIGKVCKAVKHMFEVDPELLANEKTKKKNPASDTNQVDEIAMEETQAFKMRMGRWRRHAWTVLQDPLFERIVLVMNRTRGPWMHLSHFLKKILVPDGNGHLCQLVCGKAKEIYQDFDTMAFGHLPSSRLVSESSVFRSGLVKSCIARARLSASLLCLLFLNLVTMESFGRQWGEAVKFDLDWFVEGQSWLYH